MSVQFLFLLSAGVSQGYSYHETEVFSSGVVFKCNEVLFECPSGKV